jgi:hypothetical protein
MSAFSGVIMVPPAMGRAGQRNAGSILFPAGAAPKKYFLRAYDLSCSPPVPTYWTSSTPNTSGAPSPPCGGSYGPVTILGTEP